MRSGDTVLHRATGEKWLVAYVRDGYLAWYGWPPGVVRADECELVKACSDEEHEASLRTWADREGASDRRTAVCRAQLDELLESRGEFTRIRAVTTVHFEPLRSAS